MHPPDATPDVDERILPRHRRWDEFIARLSGPEGCCFTAYQWICFGDTRLAEKILAEMGLETAVIYDCLHYFKKYGGYCDCEIVLNVARRG
jgi:hypothetical protein